MDRDEIVQLLQVVQGYDSRNIDGLMVNNWLRVSQIGRWTLATAVEAVHQHFTSSTDWLMPGHITKRVRDAARQPAPVSEVLAVGGPPPASAETRERVLRLVRELAERKSIPQDD